MEPVDKPLASSVTAYRVARWYGLLVRCGVADTLRDAIEARLKVRRRRTVTVEQQAESAGKGLDVGDTEEAELELIANVPAMIRAFGEEGALLEMVAIVCDVSEEEAETVTMDRLEQDAPFFIAQSAKPIIVLLGFASNI